MASKVFTSYTILPRMAVTLRRGFFMRFLGWELKVRAWRSVFMERLIARELMDDDENVGTHDQWRESLADLSWVNACLGGWSALRG
jgi:hypothetical protein